MTRGKLLVLDDDETVGQVLLVAAQASGFEARLCAEVLDFFEALGSGWAPTHVVIDLGLGAGSGLDVLSRLAAMGCRARIVICSGSDRPVLEAALAQARGLGLDAAGVLPKPFTLAQLRALLADAA